MFAIGLFSVFQVFFAPGILILQLMRFRGNVLERLAFSVGLSLIANYCGVLILAVLGLYQRPIVFAAVALELATLVYLGRGFLAKPFSQVIADGWRGLNGWINAQRVIWDEENKDRLAIQIIKYVFALLAAIVAMTAVWWTVRLFAYNLGQVFNTWDAILSWNQWAVIWAQGRLPSGTSLYPQLMPANWSLLYVIQGDATLQLFAKAMMPIFSFLIFLLMTGYGFETRMAGFFIGVELTRLMFKKFTGESLTDGYVDIPATFFGFLAVYALLKARQFTSPQQRLRFAQLALIFAAGAAVTKQMGLYILLLTPLLAYLLVFRQPAQAPEGRVHWKPILVSAGIAALIALPWYVYKLVSIQLGMDVSNISYLTGEIHASAGLLERALAAFQMLEKYSFLLLFLLPAFFVLDSGLRWIAAVVILPYTLIWAFFFSYDARNLALALPFIGCCAGVGVQRLISIGLDGIARLKILSLRVVFFVSLMLLAGVSFNFILTDTNLHQQQIAQQRQIFNSQLNEKLYAYIAQYGPTIRILTNYPVAYLPGLENNQVNFWYRDPQEFDYFVQDQTITHLLVPNNAHPQILAKIDEELASGHYQLIFEDSGFIPTRFIRIR